MLCAPPGEQTQAFPGVSDLVRQIVGPAAERVDVVKILMQTLGKEEADDGKIFVVRPRQIFARRVRARERRWPE